MTPSRPYRSVERSTLLIDGTVNRTVQRWVSRTLIACGSGVLIWVAATFVSTAVYRHSVQAALDQGEFSPARGDEPGRPTWLAIGVPIGTLEIERVGLAGVVIEGDDTDVLANAIGHLPDTPLPWNDGNSALAAHREDQFEPLQHVRAGDLVRLRTPHGTLDYIVRETLIVEPEDVWVLDQTANPMLTLISCYPFRYVGPAPQRFIVRGDRVSQSHLRVALHRLEWGFRRRS
jgi:sortase A